MKYTLNYNIWDWDSRQDRPRRFSGTKTFSTWEEAVEAFLIKEDSKDPNYLCWFDRGEDQVHLFDERGCCLDRLAFADETNIKKYYSDLPEQEAVEYIEQCYSPLSKSLQEAWNLYLEIPSYENMFNKEIRSEDDRVARAYWALLGKYSTPYIKKVLRACSTQDITKAGNTGQVMKDIIDSMLNRMSKKQLDIAYQICCKQLSEAKENN